VTSSWGAAYLDASHAFHVQKGKAPHHLDLDPTGTDMAKAEKQLASFATWVAGQS
jgi:hypothetical protein